jgi:hypothetical protein
MIKRLIPVLGLLLIAVGAGAEDFWKARPVREWTKKQTQSFLRDSPWVRQVTAGGVMQSPLSQPAVETAECCAGKSVSPRPRLSEEYEVRRGATTYHIVWSSATVVRQARQHLLVLAERTSGEIVDAGYLDSYRVTVTGGDLGIFQGHTEAQIKAESYLDSRRTKLRVPPDRVIIGRFPDGRVSEVGYVFPRAVDGQAAISDPEARVEFRTRARGVTLRAVFDLARMVTARGPDF